jgi:protein-tyrosine-phosphatase
VRVLREDYGIDITDQHPTHLDDVGHLRFDRVVSLCDRVREARSELRDQQRPTHWSIPDPADSADRSRAGYQAFRRVAADIETRVRYLLPTLTPTIAQETQP